ncbi:hypothetical protein B4U79_17268 [Dinothrombium tinctorium]|uniref:Protein kinase domain-containing protein n=1 Tax=Dinothrombium tinctorium TaxID=1965070 RepID=A0A3S3P8U0_9ACAR|nr:hypothetical protein B4U79_17268 [Dinothrombium tinctorium]
MNAKIGLKKRINCPENKPHCCGWGLNTYCCEMNFLAALKLFPWFYVITTLAIIFTTSLMAKKTKQKSKEKKKSAKKARSPASSSDERKSPKKSESLSKAKSPDKEQSSDEQTSLKKRKKAFKSKKSVKSSSSDDQESKKKSSKKRKKRIEDEKEMKAITLVELKRVVIIGKFLSLLSYLSFWKPPFITTNYLVGITLQSHSSLLYNRLYYNPVQSDPDSIDNYQILSTMHKDNWNVVYKARQKKSGKLFVIRVFEHANIVKYNLDQILNDKENLLISLRHWLFPVTHSVFRSEKRALHFVQNYVNGVRLADLLENHKNGLPEIVTKFIAAQVLIAIEYLHKANVLIRDIHALNVMILKDCYIKILAITMGEVLDIDSSYSKTLRGRLGFMPPEFIRREIWTRESDCWCYGVFLYHITFGKTPFESVRGIRTVMARINLNRYDIPFLCSFWLKHLIKGLFCPLTQRRLNTSDIARHRWFEEINFEQLSRKTLEAPKEFQYFVNYYWKQKKIISDFRSILQTL